MAKWVQETALAEQTAFGVYLGTYFSDNAQVRVDLFRRGSDLDAYVSFLGGFTFETITDAWLTGLRREVGERDLGSSDQIRLKYTP